MFCLGFTPTVKNGRKAIKIKSNENSRSMKKQLAIIATLFKSSICYLEGVYKLQLRLKCVSEETMY